MTGFILFMGWIDLDRVNSPLNNAINFLSIFYCYNGLNCYLYAYLGVMSDEGAS